MNNKGSIWIGTLFLMTLVMMMVASAFIHVDLRSKQVQVEKNMQHINDLSESLGKAKAKEIIIAFNEAQSQIALQITEEDKNRLDEQGMDNFDLLISAKAYIQIVETYFNRSSERPYLYMKEQIPFKLQVQADRQAKEQTTYLESRLYTSNILDVFDATLNQFTNYAELKTLVKKIEQAISGTLDPELFKGWFDKVRAQLMDKDVYRLTINTETRDPGLSVYNKGRLQIVLRIQKQEGATHHINGNHSIYFIPAYTLAVDSFQTIP